MGKKPLIDEAISAIQKGQTEKAIKTLEIITQKEPMDEEAWLLLSKVVGNPREEVECLSRIISINPGNYPARLRLIKLYDSLKEKGLEEKDFSFDGLAESSDAVWDRLRGNHIDSTVNLDQKENNHVDSSVDLDQKENIHVDSSVDLDHEITMPILIRPIRTRQKIINRMILYFFLIPACLGLPFLIAPYLHEHSDSADVILFLAWGLSGILLISLFRNIVEYRLAIQLDQEGVQILVPVKGRLIEKVHPDSGGEDAGSIFLFLVSIAIMFYKYNFYFIEYELPGSIYCRGYVSKKIYVNSEVGNNVAVRYLIDNPQAQRIESLSDA